MLKTLASMVCSTWMCSKHTEMVEKYLWDRLLLEGVKVEDIIAELKKAEPYIETEDGMLKMFSVCNMEEKKIRLLQEKYPGSKISNGYLLAPITYENASKIILPF